MFQPLFTDLSPDICAVLAFDQPELSKHLHAEELKCLPDSASSKRKKQFQLGRCAAREALRRAGIPSSSPLLRDSSGLPIWPEETCGSISHTGSFGCAAACRQSAYQSLGIDVEQIRTPRQEKLPEKLFTESNVRLIRSEESLSKIRFTSFFSACESIFKSIAPLSDKRPHFKDVQFEESDSEDTLLVQWKINRTTLPDELLPSQVLMQIEKEFLVTLSIIK